MDSFLIVCILIETTVLLVLSVLFFMNFRKMNSNNSGRRKIYVDTSTLIDGRILQVAKSNFLSDDLIIPRSVLRELQILADGKDKQKRLAARKGLDVVSELERMLECNAYILNDELDHTPVDDRLIELAHKNHGVIMTNDYNLNKVASTEGIVVLNINILAGDLRDEYYPGLKISVKIEGIGENRGQGVAHLENGTMVVVEKASSYVGKEISAEVLRFMQTPSGRMIFAKRISARKR